MRSPALVRRVAAWLAGVWAGLIAAVGFVAAPVLFSVLPRAEAGHAAAHLFAVEAGLGLAVAALLLLLAFQEARANAEVGGSRFSAEMLLVLAALFCIVAGHYAIQPMLASAGHGGVPSFALLHGVASAFFVARFIAVAILAWRLVGGAATVGADPRSAATPS